MMYKQKYLPIFPYWKSSSPWSSCTEQYYSDMSTTTIRDSYCYVPLHGNLPPKKHWNLLVFFLIKPTGCINFPKFLWNETLHISDSSSVHHQEFFTVRTAMVYVIQVCRQLSSKIRIHPDLARQLSTNVYDIYHCCAYSEKLLMMDWGTVRNM